MKGVALWALGAIAAFLATAGAFLLLANLLGNPAASDPIPQADPPQAQGSGPTLLLDFPEDRLEGLEKRPGQRLALDVENGGNEELPSVDLTLDATSGNTARPRKRSYRETVGRLAPGESTTVEFEIDLSPQMSAEGREANPAGADPQPREVLEARATTPEGASAVKTAVLAP
ncbi:MAG: hypothetical protein H0X57_09915 [Rubrobacter sp.]|nr:hypothetical protein [Rubrobacter sp.]